MMRSTARRAFMQGAGLGAFALPFLRQTSARAAAPANARRLVVFGTPCGTEMSAFWPGSGNTYGRILKPLEPMKRKLLVMRGINMETAYRSPVPANHDPDNPNMLTARQSTGNAPGDMGGISVDQHIANSVGKQTKIASLQVGVNVFSLCACVSSRGPKQGIFPERNPYNAYTRLFGDALAQPNDLDRLRQDRRSVIDALTAEVTDLRCALGTEERPKLDAHLESIRELERGLDAMAIPTQEAGCTPPDLGPPLDESGSTYLKNFPHYLKLQMDVVIAALACDLTRIVTLLVSHGSSFLPFRWLGINFPHHSIAHGDASVTASASQRTEWLLQIDSWHAQQFLYLIQKLDAIGDGDGTLLDHSAVLWAHEQSDGATHSRRDMPYVLAGSCRGAFQLNRAVNFGGKAHNGLLISLANAMGVPTQQFGDPDFSRGPLSGL